MLVEELLRFREGKLWTEDLNSGLWLQVHFFFCDISLVAA